VTKKPARRARTRRGGDTFATADWRDIYDALMDAANQYHSGPKADRAVALARKIREEKL
jgi:hypothetical protein